MARLGSELARVDPELRRLARLLPGGYALHRGLRLPRALMNLAGRTGRLARVDAVTVNPHVAIRLHQRPELSEPGPALLWIHGGGTVMGSAAQEDGFCRKLMNFTDIAVVAVDHRLAPEHPYPTPLEDCYAALIWLARQPWVDPTRIAIGGASAGGGLAAALAYLARDRGDVAPVLQMLVYPMLDDRTGADDPAVRVMWSGRDNVIAWRWYLGSADPATAVPARRTDLSGLAPAWVGVGDLDLFHDEALAYSARLQAAGVPAHVHVAGGAFHAFDMISPNAVVSQRFFSSQCRALRAAVGATTL
ncbi:alpha/beta hydrolase [Mycobacterium sp. 236(2023)]|uniref:alpha/beta hydrolase n=1 Tax=Mycobacterium sp. 236(2023) TaxID=3038163 RepID=UPI0024153142|nr:alpha/beta hydrolase [Mycobacterium sp. 236(2023)]MDG4662965.1 alpha/beta hydrolase [Mycobacterium sp. 236(2023)]